jgi:UDP-N-acetylmuramate dehydrogenase
MNAVIERDLLSEFRVHLTNQNIRFEEKVNLSQFTYMKTGGTARLIVFPSNEEQMVSCVKWAYENELKYKVIGSTSNLLFLDDSSYGCLICTSDLLEMSYNSESRQIFVGSGVMMPDLSRKALFEELTGFEGLEGIPGTVGGGVFMNAGAYGCEVKDTLIQVNVVRHDGTTAQYSLKEAGLTHRASMFRKTKTDEIIVSCVFEGKKGNPQSIFAKMELYHAKRHRYQDFFYPNLGSIFSGSPYRAIGQDDKYFKLISAIYYFFCYEWKIFRRESPINRKWLNDIVVKRFGLNYEKQPFSDKTLNCLVNRGQGTAEMVRFIEEMKEKTKGRIPIENEVVEGF